MRRIRLLEIEITKRNVTLELNVASRRELLYFFRELEMHFQFLVCVVVHSALKIKKIMQLTNLGLGMSGCTVLIYERLNIDILIA